MVKENWLIQKRGRRENVRLDKIVQSSYFKHISSTIIANMKAIGLNNHANISQLITLIFTAIPTCLDIFTL